MNAFPHTMNRLAGALALLVFFSMPALGQGNPLKEGALFKKLAGQWEGRGQINGGDGSVRKFRETWSGKLEDDGAFVITGSRDLDEEPPHTFGWKYLFNPTTELIEVEMILSTVETPVRLEAQLDEAAGTITLKGQLNSDGTELRIVSRVEGEGEDAKLIGEVTLESPGGGGFTGSIEHRRPQAWEKKAE